MLRMVLAYVTMARLCDRKLRHEQLFTADIHRQLAWSVHHCTIQGVCVYRVHVHLPGKNVSVTCQ